MARSTGWVLSGSFVPAPTHIGPRPASQAPHCRLPGQVASTSSPPKGFQYPSAARTVARRAHRCRADRPESKAVGCLLYTSDAADDLLCVDLGGRRIITK